MNLFGRVPVIALDYSQKDKAVPKELMVDYNTGNIYVVSAVDKTKIFDITSQIKSQIDNIKGANINVSIEGVGTVNLQQLMNEFKTSIDSSVQISHTTDDISYVSKENVLDNMSLNIHKHNIQLKDFINADEFTIPQKRNGKLIWVPMVQLSDNENKTPASSSDINAGGEIISPSNPDNGEKLLCTIIEPSDHKLYLRASRRQKSLYVSIDCKVVLPTTVDQYSEIQWMYISNNNPGKFSYPENVFWNSEPSSYPFSIHCITFKTWDNGTTWVAKLEVYNKNSQYDNRTPV